MGMLRAAWRDTTPDVRALCVTLWLGGVLATAAGLWGDAAGWWDERGFLANLASSAAGGLFGVPFALVVIQYITARQADERERREVRHQASALARDLAADARQLVRVEAYPQAVATLRAALHDARAALQRDAEADAIGRAYGLWQEMVSSRTTTEVLLDRIGANWRTLKEDTRPRLQRIGAEWLDRELVELLDETLTPGLSAGMDLYWMDEVRHAAIELVPRPRQHRETRAHLRRIDLADEHLRRAERVGRYTDEVWRHLVRQEGVTA